MPNLLASSDFYKRFYPFWKKYKNDHRKYFQKIDDLISERKLSAESILDVGCGDGERGICLFSKLKAKNITLLDSCGVMLDSVDKVFSQYCLLKDISESKDDFPDPFDLVVCLNNVLGHVGGESRRSMAIANMKKAMKKDGLLIIDVNNRHNISNYGLQKALINLLIDSLPFVKTGDFKLEKADKNGTFATKVHLFTDREMTELFDREGLKVVDKYVIDYETGEIKKSVLSGQLLYVVKK